MSAGRQASEQARQARLQASQAREQASIQASRARQQAIKAASRAAPYAANAKVSASHGVHSIRAWAAPRLEQSAQALEQRIAPKMSAMMSATAHRIEPARSKSRRRWPFLVAGLITLGAAAGVAIVKWRSSGMPWQQNPPQEESPSQQAEPAADGKAAESNAKVRSR